ncbi:raffinose/stachyose/melibiose transport system substrate-binding protein [Paenibacillus sp. V4I3]|uniref:ABC transporter substrate-binding protein n=1 Tax=Paenibacillus sp. V4I3 TaxID=3042305 RepID=UPI00278880B6|nr:extracellular solute-binding protein [Paenibacillus sp. V4I3]MDQ0877255.1 raffinose/stachyose/melibiose transport system substrate-binding protein [Paenibacillus sp. V4I3]
MSNRKWVSSLALVGVMAMTALTGCGGTQTATSTPASAGTEATKAAAQTAKPAQPVKLKLAMWDTKADLEFWTEKAKEYSKIKPNVTVEVEKVPDNGGQYLKVRLAANDLPDLMYLKPTHFQIYKQALLPLDELAAVKNNKYPTKVDGKVLGVPLVAFSEFVYFHPSIFKELGIEVPKTFPEFMATMEKVKASGKYTPLAIGGKDDWTFYPLMEFGPHILSGDEQYLASLAKNPAPFAAGSTFDKMGKVIKEIADKKYAGPDALSVSFDQSTQSFESKKSAMIALGQWYYASYMEKVKADDDLGVFPLPFRDTTSTDLQSIMMSDMNVGINKSSKNVEEAKAFYEWMFSNDVYTAFINKLQQFSTVNGVTSELPFFNKWTTANPYKPFIYYATDEGYAKVSAAAQFDSKKAAQSIFAGKSIDAVEKELNEKWKKAIDAAAK